MIRSISHLLAAVFSNAADFNRHWRLDDTKSVAETGVAYRWTGEWISETNGHRGALRCLLTQTSPTEYAANFYAVYAGVLRVCYSVPLHGRKNDKTLILEGDADIGRLAGGVYHYSGEATAQAFRCTYQCKYDRGIFEMSPASRPK